MLEVTLPVKAFKVKLANPVALFSICGPLDKFVGFAHCWFIIAIILFLTNSSLWLMLTVKGGDAKDPKDIVICFV